MQWTGQRGRNGSRLAVKTSTMRWLLAARQHAVEASRRRKMLRPQPQQRSTSGKCLQPTEAGQPGRRAYNEVTDARANKGGRRCGQQAQQRTASQRATRCKCERQRVHAARPEAGNCQEPPNDAATAIVKPGAGGGRIRRPLAHLRRHPEASQTADGQQGPTPAKEGAAAAEVDTQSAVPAGLRVSEERLSQQASRGCHC